MALLTVPTPRSARVAWVSTWNIPCGIATYSRFLLDNYRDAAKSVFVICDERTEQLITPASPTARHGWRWASLDVAPRIASTVAAIDAAAIVVQFQPGLLGWENLLPLLENEQVKGRTIVIVLHSLDGLSTRGDQAAILTALKKATRVLVHNVRELDALKGYGVFRNVTLFPHGALPPTRNRPITRDLPRSSNPLIGAYGFFFPHKGFYDLIEALSETKKLWPSAKLRLVTSQYPSDASLQEITRCRQLAESLGISDSIEWNLDYLPDERSLSLLGECDLLVLPYRHTVESASGAVRVAMASRVPILVTPIPIFEEMGDALLRSETSSVASLADGISRVLSNSALRSSAVNRADSWLEAHSWAHVGRRIAGMISGLVENAKYS